jgi:cytidine deaminase
MTEPSVNISDLKAKAKLACAQAYAPYSQFAVGAVVSDDQGRVFAGCNVENASYGLTQCAERNAIASAVVAGVRDLSIILIYTPGEQIHAPCGACRQVIGELLLPGAAIISCCDSETYQNWNKTDLLPYPFEKSVLVED